MNRQDVAGLFLTALDKEILLLFLAIDGVNGNNLYKKAAFKKTGDFKRVVSCNSLEGAKWLFCPLETFPDLSILLSTFTVNGFWHSRYHLHMSLGDKIRRISYQAFNLLFGEYEQRGAQVEFKNGSNYHKNFIWADDNSPRIREKIPLVVSTN